MGTVEPIQRATRQVKGRDLSDLDDESLMVLVKAEREDALQALIQRHQDFIIGFASRFLGDRSAGRDVAQDVFLSLWADRDRYRSRDRFKGYLYRVALNRCRNLARHRSTRRRKLDEMSADPASRGQSPDVPIDTLVRLERAREVQERLTELPDRPRQVIILRFTHGMPLGEIAATTGLPLGTVKSHLSRGLKRLGKLLPQEAP